MSMTFGMPLAFFAGDPSGCHEQPSLFLEIGIAVLVAPDKS